MRSRSSHLLFVLVCFFAFQLGAAQQAPVVSAKPPELNETQQLQLDNLRKDFRIAEQQVQLLRAQLAEATRAQQEASNRFWNLVAELRNKVKAPESDFDFDANTLRFIPKKKQAPAGSQ